MKESNLKRNMTYNYGNSNAEEEFAMK